MARKADPWKIGWGQHL